MTVASAGPSKVTCTSSHLLGCCAGIICLRWDVQLSHSCHLVWEGTLGLKAYLAVMTHCFALGSNISGAGVKMGLPPSLLLSHPMVLPAPLGVPREQISLVCSLTCPALVLQTKTTRMPFSWGKNYTPLTLFVIKGLLEFYKCVGNRSSPSAISTGIWAQHSSFHHC